MWRDDAHLLDIVVAAKWALRFVKGMTWKDFDASQLHQDAVERGAIADRGDPPARRRDRVVPAHAVAQPGPHACDAVDVEAYVVGPEVARTGDRAIAPGDGVERHGGVRGDGEHIGRSGDEGVDGVIREDKLGLDLVYVQAKRWQANVGRPDVQAFVGSLAGLKARKGVFITTSAFSKEARDYLCLLYTSPSPRDS